MDLSLRNLALPTIAGFALMPWPASSEGIAD